MHRGILLYLLRPNDMSFGVPNRNLNSSLDNRLVDGGTICSLRPAPPGSRPSEWPTKQSKRARVLNVIM